MEQPERSEDSRQAVLDAVCRRLWGHDESTIRIADICHETGLSSSVIYNYFRSRQGLIDAALALRPEERRVLFEEAAGIGLYQSKKQNALEKLEETQRNLLRVSDIVNEIAPRLPYIVTTWRVVSSDRVCFGDKRDEV